MEIIRSKIKDIEKQISSLKEKKYVIIKEINNLEEQKEKLQHQYSSELKNVNCRDWANERFNFSEKIEEILVNVFKLKSFRPQQLAAINAILNRKHVLLLMPTGGGKSLCYQLPSFITSGVTVVVSPLVSLMEDQLFQLNMLNIKGAIMSSTTPNQDKKAVLDYLNYNKGERIRLIYVTPEWLAKSKRFMSGLQKCYAAKKFDLLAIDEVHCISTWGHDFRPDYSYLSLMRPMFPDLPIIGLTATATTNILIDVQKVLDIPDCVTVKAPFDRPNLFFQIITKPNKEEDCLSFLIKLIKEKYAGHSGIIYTATIKDCEDVAKRLRQGGLSVRSYHAELDKDRRKAVHEKWLLNKVQVIIGTVAFGMGIDKPDVRFVIHYSLPKSVESLYQEAGRAGRDGLNADCIVMFKLTDYLKQSAYISSKEQITNVRAMLDYCLNLTECRHVQIGKHFEEVSTELKACNKMCDNCVSKYELEVYDVSQITAEITNTIKKENAAENSLTLNKLMTFLTKKKEFKSLNSEQIETVIGHLILQDYIKEERSYTAYRINTYLNCGDRYFTNMKIHIHMRKSNNLNSLKVNKKREPDSDDDCTITDVKKVKLVNLPF